MTTTDQDFSDTKPLLMSRASISSARSLSSSSSSSTTTSSASSSPLTSSLLSSSAHEDDLLLNNNNNNHNYKISSASNNRNNNNNSNKTKNNNNNVKDNNNFNNIFNNTNTNNKFRKDLTRNVFFQSTERSFAFNRKSTRWRNFWKRKSIIYFIAIGLLIILINLTLNHDFMHNSVEMDETARELEENRYFVKHLHSHVPGMKVLKNLTSLLSKNNKKKISPKTTKIFAATKNVVETATLLDEENKFFIKSFDIEQILSLNISSSLPSSTTTTTATSTTTTTASSILKKFTILNDLTQQQQQHQPPPEGYLVWSEYCKMPNLDPYLPEIMKHFHREKYKPCQILTPLTRVEFNISSQRYILRINSDVVLSYTKTGKVDCCYQSILRDGVGAKADSQISYSECMSFFDKSSLPLDVDNILVKCFSNKKQVYINGHPLMPERQEIRERLTKWAQYDERHKREKPPNVLMIGIDSISRVNLIRAMPKTAKYLYDNEWFEMSGFNKIDDNTFPNLMAVLTGMNKTTSMKRCSPYIESGLDNCDFIWKTYRDHGYVTAYAEDEASINTFNYLKLGFTQPPVDYYLRPFLLGTEKKLQKKLKSNLIDCLGYKHSADHVYDYAIELARRYRNDSFFGLFWTNTFSHNDISDCSAMDEHMTEYLRKFAQMGTLENTIVLFFSDHGMRYGPTRKTHSGHLEERLPFVFLWLPARLRQKYPSFVNALSINKNRLTNPYDTHMTLKHILALSGRVENETRLSQASSCAKCQSLLMPVPHNRSCIDAAIEPHWCTCLYYESIYKNSKTVVNLTHLLINYINDYVANYKNKTIAKLCVPLQYGNVESAYRSNQPRETVPGNDQINSSTIDIYRITFYTKPNKGLFEATALYDPVENYFEVTGEISRLNTYSSDSECVSDGGAKKYCSCHKKIF